MLPALQAPRGLGGAGLQAPQARQNERDNRRRKANTLIEIPQTVVLMNVAENEALSVRHLRRAGPWKLRGVARLTAVAAVLDPDPSALDVWRAGRFRHLAKGEWLRWEVEDCEVFAEIEIESSAFKKGKPNLLCKLSGETLDRLGPPFVVAARGTKPTQMKLPVGVLDAVLQQGPSFVTPLAYAQVAWGAMMAVHNLPRAGPGLLNSNNDNNDNDNESANDMNNHHGNDEENANDNDNEDERLHLLQMMQHQQMMGKMQNQQVMQKMLFQHTNQQMPANQQMMQNQQMPADQQMTQNQQMIQTMVLKVGGCQADTGRLYSTSTASGSPRY